MRQQHRRLCTECLAKRTLIVPNKSFVANAAAHHFKTDSRRRREVRDMATIADTPQRQSPDHGPLAEYDARVQNGKLRDDEHQRTLIQALQDLHDTLIRYKAPKVIHPTIESLQPKKKSFFGSMFGGSSEGSNKARISPDLPKGLYMYGDVGSGKTMLMDLFFDTLPTNIKSKTRIHFHNFMQDVHKQLHKMTMRYGNDIDAIPFVAASIAEEASVLCFD